jgi:conjugative transposon TraM protein
MKQISQKMLRQRKFLFVLPLLVIPFLTMGFWALGGGKNADTSGTTASSPGLNMDLPAASLKEDKALDKMGYYDRAATDSLKLQEQMKNDPYFTKSTTAADSVLDALTGNIPRIANSATVSGYTGGSNYADPNEAKVYAKLGQLNAAMKDAATAPKKNSYRDAGYSPQPADIERLEQLMQAGGNNPGTTGDPEMKQLNGMLEKILDIQHPERLKPSQKTAATTSESLTISTATSSATFSLFDTGNAKSPVGFFGLNDKAVNQPANAIEAVVHESQTLMNGAVVKMRLLSDADIGGHRIGKDHFVYGIANLNKERLEVSVTSIRDGESLYPVKLEVFDMDGLPGIYIPGAIGRDVAKQSGDNALQSVSLGTVDPSLGIQAASAGIETAKNLLSRKVKLIKVQVKAGYKILLKNNSN